MFGTPLMINWAVKFTKANVIYYLSSANDSFDILVWSTRREKAKPFSHMADATKASDMIKNIRKKNKLDIHVTQV